MINAGFSLHVTAAAVLGAVIPPALPAPNLASCRPDVEQQPVVQVTKRRALVQPGTWAAGEVASARCAALVIAKLDRLARKARFLLHIVEGTGEASVMFCDLPSMPQDPVGKFLLTQMPISRSAPPAHTEMDCWLRPDPARSAHSPDPHQVGYVH